MKRKEHNFLGKKVKQINNYDYWANAYPICIVLIFSLFTLQCTDRKHERAHQSTEGSSEQIYYCPMDTQIVQNKPGTCPICGMDLIPKPGAHPHHSNSSGDWIYKPSNITVLSTVKSIKPMIKTLPINIEVNGYITYDENTIKTISAKTGGRIEKLYLKYNFQPIKSGEPIFELFSHELQASQQEYLYLKQTEAEGSQLLTSAESKLLFLGMTREQIKKLNSVSHLHSTVTVYSPISGFVFENKNDVVNNENTTMDNTSGMEQSNVAIAENKKEISLREGAYVNKSNVLFKIATTQTVWGVFEVFTDQLPNIRKNQKIHIKVENTNEMIMGNINFIEPTYKKGTGTTRIRVFLNNKDQHLKIGNFLNGEIEAGEKKGLWIPQTAVYDLGKDKIVFLKKGEVYETHKVKLGPTVKDQVEVIEGLSEMDEISENAQYLVDSESFVKIKK